MLIPYRLGVLSSNAPNNTACTGDTVVFAASGGGGTAWYEFLVNNSVEQASTTASFTYGPVLTDNVSITLRTYTVSTSICYDEDTINLRLNSVSGNNTLNTAIAPICAGSSPTTILSVSSFVADRQSEGYYNPSVAKVESTEELLPILQVLPI